MGADDRSGGRGDRAAPLAGLRLVWEVVLGTLRKISRHRVSFSAAGVAFYLLVSLVPGLAGIVLIYGSVADPADVRVLFGVAEDAVPAELIAVMEREVQRIADAKVSGWTVVLGVLVAVWSGGNAIDALTTGLNIAHSAHDTRRFWPRMLVSLGMAVAGLLFLVAVVGLLAVIPIVLNYVGFGSYGSLLVSWARWPALVLVMMVWLSLLYRWAPDQKGVRWKWVTWGSAAASLLWVAGSALFTAYVAKFGTYSAVYGSIGAVVVTMMWLYFSSLLVLLGEELNVEVERLRGRGCAG